MKERGSRFVVVEVLLMRKCWSCYDSGESGQRAPKERE
jgi:hypothetical protein